MINQNTSEVVPPLVPTWRRYKDIFIKNRHLSIYRALEYEMLSQIDYSGRVLDLGGGENAHYLPDLKRWGNNIDYESVNVDAEIKPTYIGDANGVLGVPGNHYDMVITFNTLEHIYDIKNALTETIKALKSNGRLVIGMPFLYRIHAHPYDFHRPTAEWWIETLERMDLKDIKIRPVVWDLYTSGLSISLTNRLWDRLRRYVIPLYGVLHGWLRGAGGKHYPATAGELISAYTLGYVITATKP